MSERRSRPWYKSPTRVKRPLAYFRLSQPARATWNSLWDLAGLSDAFDGGVREGALALDLDDVAGDTGLPIAQQQAAIKALIKTGLVEQRDSTYFIPAFVIAQRRDQTAAERKAAQRASHAESDERAGQSHELQQFGHADGVTSHAELPPSGLTGHAEMSQSGGTSHAHGVLEDREEIEQRLRSSSSASPQTTNSVSAASSPRLPLDLDERERASAIKRAVWREIEPIVGRSFTKTEWGKRNNRVALDLARLGVSPDDVVAAHRSVSARLGEPARMLSLVQDELAKIAASASATPRPPSRAPGFNATSTFRDYGDTPFEDEVLA